MFDRTAFAEIVTRTVQGGIAGILGGVVLSLDGRPRYVPCNCLDGGRDLAPTRLAPASEHQRCHGCELWPLLCSTRRGCGPVPSVAVNGFLWWFLGPLTLMPIALGMGPQWTASAIAGSVGSLIWHLVFGGVMGIAYAAIAQEGLLAVGPTVDTEAGQTA